MLKEEWKGRGKCSECRRQAYCKTQCSANKKHFQYAVFQSMAKVFAERLNKKNGT